MSSTAQNIKNEIKSFASGEPGSTGREVFEDSTATGPAERFRSDGGHGAHGTAGDAIGVGSNARVGSGAEQYAAGETGLGGSGLGSSGLGSAGTTGTTGTGHHHHHHGHHHEGQSGITPTSESQINQSYGSGTTTGTSGAFDKTGNLDQNAALYERTGNQGPATAGAAGTDRFDTDKGLATTGGIGDSGRAGTANLGSSGTGTGSTFGTHGSQPVQDTTERAEGKGTGGVLGVLGTSDKDFTGRERTGGVSGAYADSDAHFKGNTSGPGGHTALTGREGNLENNPVAAHKAESAEHGNAGTGSVTGDHIGAGSHTTAGTGTGTGAHDTTTTSGTHSTGTTTAADGTQHKESLIEKAKHAVGL